MSVIPLRKDQPPPPEPLRKRRVSTMAGIEDHCDGPIEMIAASDGSIELLCRKRTIRIEGKLLVDLFFRREAEVSQHVHVVGTVSRQETEKGAAGVRVRRGLIVQEGDHYGPAEHRE